MKKRNLVKLNLKGLTVLEKIQLLRTVANKIDGNPTYIDLQPRVAAMRDRATQMELAYQKAEEIRAASIAATAVLKERHDAANDELTLLVMNVNLHADGREVYPKELGLELNQSGKASSQIEQVVHLKLQVGDEMGSLLAKWKPVDGATRYHIETSMEVTDPTMWTFYDSCSASQFEFTGLTSGELIWVRVQALAGKKRKGAWSDPARKTVP